MAIKLPDPGNGIPEQKTGNDEWTNMKIVRDNFADQSNAASRLVGDGLGQVPLREHISDLAFSCKGMSTSWNQINQGDVSEFPFGIRFAHQDTTGKPANQQFNTILTIQGYSTTALQLAMPYSTRYNEIYIRAKGYGKTNYEQWAKIYTDQNTTVDSNKNIKQSSPVVRVFADHLDKIHEANDLLIEYNRNGVGDYTITGTTGLRENDWQIVIPKDDHDNQLIAFTLEDDKGTIRLKTYKRTFNMTTFMFEPDLNAPLDIPEGRWVDLHFNDLPQEQTDEPTI